MKRYREIEFGLGDIDSAMKELKSHKDLVCGSFNGKILYSDIDDLDSAYKKITGKTKAQFDAYQKSEHEKYLEEERKHKESIPRLAKKWIKRGNEILDKEYQELWVKTVPIRLGDLYRGMELGACLEIIKPLNNGCDVKKAKDIIDNQGHSGMSYGLVRLMVKSFCNRGDEFYNYTKP